jgi:uncharacterized protein (TIGR02246 family)
MKKIQNLLETYKIAVQQKDIEAYCSIFDEDVKIFDMWQSWSIDGLKAWRAMAKEWFASLGENIDVVTFDNVQIHLHGEMAHVSAFVRFTAVSPNGTELRFLENRLTWVIEKKVQSWKVIHQHTSGPVDFNTMKVILQRPS